MSTLPLDTTGEEQSQTVFGAQIPVNIDFGKCSVMNSFIYSFNVVYSTFHILQDQQVAVRLWQHQTTDARFGLMAYFRFEPASLVVKKWR